MSRRSSLHNAIAFLWVTITVCPVAGCGTSTAGGHGRPRLGEAMGRSVQGAERSNTAAPADTTLAAPGGARVEAGPVSGVRDDQAQSSDPVAGMADALVRGLVGEPAQPGPSVVSGTVSSDPGELPSDPANDRTHILLGASVEAPAGRQFDPSPAGRAGVGLYINDRMRFAFLASLTSLRLSEDTQADRAVTDAWELAGEGALKLYLTRAHTTMGLYAMGGVRVGLFHWDYRAAVEVMNQDGTTDRIESDNLIVIAPYLGAGISLLQTPRFHLGASAAWGLRLYSEETDEGFENDFFNDVGFTQLGLEVLVFL